MAQLNRFTVLRQVFRGKRRDRHSKVTRVVAKVVNRRLADRSFVRQVHVALVVIGVTLLIQAMVR